MRFTYAEASLNLRVSGHLKKRLEALAASADTTLSAYLREQLASVADRAEQEQEPSDISSSSLKRRRPARFP